jgi:hypothetical protein
LTKTGDDYEVKTAHVELAERMRKVGCDNQMHWLLCFSPFYLCKYETHLAREK